MLDKRAFVKIRVDNFFILPGDHESRQGTCNPGCDRAVSQPKSQQKQLSAPQFENI